MAVKNFFFSVIGIAQATCQPAIRALCASRYLPARHRVIMIGIILAPFTIADLQAMKGESHDNG
jgi:hypothetical protein